MTSSCKIFGDDTSFFSKIENKNYSNFQLNKDLEIISQWAFQWKMLFNPDPTKRAIEVCFSHKRDKEVYPLLKFNNNGVQSANISKTFELSSFPYFTKEWDNLSEKFWKIKSTVQFKTKILLHQKYRKLNF